MRDLSTNDRWWLVSIGWAFAILVHVIVEALL